MPFTQLNRQFRPWHDDKAGEDDFRLFARGFYGDAGWPEVLKCQRVVVLAEGGSGKSREFEEQAKTLEAAGEFAFHATVQNVARYGLKGAIGTLAAARLDAWRQTGNPAWFLVDSIDEAKLDHIRLGEALRSLADGIGEGLPRARIILSGRYASWEFRADLELLQTILPIPAPKPELSDDPRHPLLRLLEESGNGRRNRNAPEKPLVVLMAPLDRERVRAFAAGQNTPNLDAFVTALDRANLWNLAQRPLDLSWLVDYWSKNQRFGPFAQMLETSLRERLRDGNVSRASRGTVDADRAFEALERIGAAMVFGRETRIEIPDSTVVFGQAVPALELRAVLPDWDDGSQAWLRDRSVFDPASLGRISLHNDNRGVVSGFLAARWLRGRLEANAPVGTVRGLLFAEADGVPIVLPSIQETAAWLSIWNQDIAREVIHRDPALLLTAGDPGSLPLSVRAAALESLVAQRATSDPRHGMLDRDTLRRFATADLAPTILQAWSRHKGSEEVRKLLLTLVEAGRLRDCAPLACEATSGTFGDHPTLLYGASAMAAAASDTEIRSFVERVKANLAQTDHALFWELLDLFFPKYLSVEDLLAFIAKNEATAAPRDHGWRGQTVAGRPDTRPELERLLQGLMREAGPDDPDGDGTEPETPKERRLAPLIQAAASRLIHLTPERQANPTVIDAAIWLSKGRHHRVRRFEDENFHARLYATSERRRVGLWQAIERLQHDPKILRWGGLANLSQLQFAGWDANLKQEDIGWLIEDGRNAATPGLRQLALDGLLSLWRDGGSQDNLLQSIRGLAALDAESAALVETRLAPRKLSAEEAELNRTVARHDKRRAQEKQKADQALIDFIDGLKANPEQLRTPPADLKPGYIDSRLYHVWHLLSETQSNEASYAVNGFGTLADILGPDLTREAEMALKFFWRRCQPTLTSSRKPTDRNRIFPADCMGIAGLSLEASADAHWAAKLSPAEAAIAAQLATLELNGFPSWLGDLTVTWPDQVRDVFLREANDHLATDPGQYGFVDKVKYTDPQLAALLAPRMIEHVEEHPDLGEAELAKALQLVIKALPVSEPPPGFLDLVLARFAEAESESIAALYLGLGFRVAPDRAIEGLTARLDTLEFPAQKRLTERLLPNVFGDRMFREGIDPAILPFAVLERLVGIAFKNIRLQDDNVHEGVFSPDRRDDAEGARGHLFHQLRMTPGRQTLDALKRLQADPSSPIPADRLTEMILARASTDAEHEPWPASEAHAMERTFDTQPRTPRELQRVALQCIADINHDLHHDQFAQGQTVKALPNEREVQKWVAHELDLRKSRAFSVTREAHVVDEKEPDIRLQSFATDAYIPIEIKISDDLSLPELKAALTTQLAKRYLREREKRHGVLLLVHQQARPKGWEDEIGTFRKFDEVVAILRADTERLASGGADAAHAKIAVIDVSDIEAAPTGKRPS